MEENQEKKSNFTTVQNPSAYKTVYETENKQNAKLGFGRGFLLPFISGVLGCTVVIGTCFGVPSIKSNLLGTTSNSESTNSSNTIASGYVSQTSLSNYSDTSIYAANKILPSIVGIKVEYNVNSLVSMFGRQTRNTDSNS